LSRHREPSGHVLHGKVDGLDNEGQHLIFCATITSRKREHTLKQWFPNWGRRATRGGGICRKFQSIA